MKKLLCCIIFLHSSNCAMSAIVLGQWAQDLQRLLDEREAEKKLQRKMRCFIDPKKAAALVRKNSA